MKKIQMRLANAESRAIWQAVLEAAAEVATWPAWKRGR